MNDHKKRALSIALGLPVLGCTLGPVAQGSHSVSSADRAGKELVGQFVCESPDSFVVADGKVHEIDLKNDVFVYAGGTGLAMIYGSEAVTNAWREKYADFFFSWFPSGMGTQVVVAHGGSRAARLVFARQPDDAEAYFTYEIDGTTRPQGVPTLAESCTPRARFDEQRRGGRLGIEAKGGTPTPFAFSAGKRELKVKGCGRHGQEERPVAMGNRAPDWGWVPYKIFFPADSPGVVELSFDRLEMGTRPVWRVDVAADGHFAFQLGSVIIAGEIFNRDSANPLVELVGSFQWSTEIELTCIYDSKKT